MFENAWRLDRDVFFSPVMNGSDWQAVHDAYARFLPSLGSQDDFIYLLGQMQGEIASSRTFLGRGPAVDDVPPSPTGLLGADYSLDAATGRYRFAYIYRGDQTRPEFAGPLGAPGLNVNTGDYLLAINGQELHAPSIPDVVLSGKTEKLSLTIATSPSGARRTIKVRPLTGTIDGSAMRDASAR